jgi:putative endonuclease
LTDSDGQRRGNLWLGQYGERVASAYLRSQGAAILRRNFRAPRGGEIDIIARTGKLLLFVEVKTRHHDSPIRPLDAVDHRKQSLIERGANAWLRKLRTREIPWRFDVIEVLVKEGKKPEVRWIRDAF